MKSTEINTGTYENELGGVAGSSAKSKPEQPSQSFAPSPRRPVPGWVVASVIAVAAAAIAFVVGTRVAQTPRSGSASGLAAAVMSVTVEPASIQLVHKEIDVTGSIWAWDPLVISTEAAGLRIESVLVEEGDTVNRGQVLATLNASILRSELERELAQLASSRASLSKAIQPNRREDINWLRAAVAQARANVAQQQSALVQARANLANAKVNATRYVDLAKQGAVSTQETENKQTAATVAEAEVRSANEKVNAAEFVFKQAEERLSMAEVGGRREDIHIAQAEVGRIQANIKRLNALIDQTIIKAPSDGLITKRDAHIGDTSTIGKALFQMVRDNRLELRAQVPERDLHKLRAGQAVSVTGVATGSKTIEGRLREVSPQVDAGTRLGMIRVDMPNGVGLKPGMFVDGSVDLAEYSALTVPSPAVLSRDDRYMVFVLNGKRAESRQVEVGARSGNLVEIKSGLQQGDRVITTGAGFLKDGDVVTVISQ